MTKSLPGTTILVFTLTFLALNSFAATPAAGTLTDSNTTITYTSGPFLVANPTGFVNGTVDGSPPQCDSTHPCDDFALTVNVSSTTTAAKLLKLKIKWAQVQAQIDLYVLDSSGKIIAASLSSASNVDPDLLLLPAVSGTYTLRLVPFNPVSQSIAGTIALVNKTPASPAPTGIAPRFQNYGAPPGKGSSAGEPSLGIDWKPNDASLKHGTTNTAGVAFFTSGVQELRASFDDCSSPAKDTWDDVTSGFVQQFVLSDPIGFVDHQTGRVFQMDLIGGEGNSFAALSDDDGKTWLAMQGGGSPAGPDHETLGAGPYAAPLTRDPNGTLYPNAVYYCSQNIVANAECSRSDDGGLTFGVGVPIFDNTQCLGGIHGHVKVAPDGTVYVPNFACGVNDATATITLSTDNGITWVSRSVPGSISVNSDPSLGIGQNNNGRPTGAASNAIYLGWINGDGHPNVAVSHDRGITWSYIYDVGAPFGIQNSVFPVVVAGDDNRAAFGFLGTPTGGNYGADNFTGIWHFYIAATYDAGQTWSTVDATPNDPVQIGKICTLGTFCSGGRNLLDFNDLSIDNQGRLMAGYADGCVGPGCTSTSSSTASHSAKASILRQSGGNRMLAAFDPPASAAPGSPKIDNVTRLSTGVRVRWFAPDNGGSAIIRYNISRSTTSGQETALGTTPNGQTTEYLDATANSNTTYYYRVTATNAVGTSGACGELTATGPIVADRGPDSCDGVDVVIDGSGDAVNPAAAGPAAGNLDTVDIQGVSFAKSGANLVTTMRLKNLSQTPINGTTSSAYNVVWTSTDGKSYATQVTLPSDPSGTISYTWGEYDRGADTLSTINFTTGTIVTGANGTISVNVPLSSIGNPTIPISDPNGTPAVRDPYGIVFAGEGPALGGAIFFSQPSDRAPESGYGQRWAVCNGGAATHLALTAPAAANPNTSFNMTVTALDATDSVASTYAGTIHFASSDAAALLPLNYAFTSADNGSHSFNVTLKTNGSQTISATDTSNSAIAGSSTVLVGSGPPPGDPCVTTPTQVVSDPTGDQTAGNPSEVDIQSVSAGEDYRYIGSKRSVFVLKVADLTTIPASYRWQVRFTSGATTYYVAMNSDLNSNVGFEYGTISGSTITTVGALDDASYGTDGTIKMTIAMSKISASAGTVFTGVNGIVQKNVGDTLFSGVESTSSANYTVRPQDPTCSPGPLPQPINVTYTKGGMNFSPSYTVKAPYIGRDGEPSLRSDKFGNTYVAAIRGVPGGTDLWYFDLRPTINGAANPNYDPLLRNPQYRGQPDAITGSEDETVGADGGGDVDIAVAPVTASQEDPNNPPVLAYTSLVVGNISTYKSTDRGKTFTKNPAGNCTGGACVDDRQWIEFFGPNTVYLLYRTFQPAVSQIQRSIDGGLTYGPARTAGAIGQVGGIDVDQNDGTVYISGSNGVVAVGIPPAAGLEPLTYTVHNVAGTGKAHIFFTVKVASDGTAYACYSDDKSILVQYSKDKGNTWSVPIRVNDGTDTNIGVMPWMETGSSPGTIGVVWYGTDSADNSDNARWNVFYALGKNVNTSNPTFQQVQLGDHVNHAANISESGLVVGGTSPNRNLLDYFQVAFDPTGAAVVAYTDDHNDFDGHTYVARQISGPGANGSTVPAPVEGSSLPPQTPFSTDGSQVTDFRRDVRDGGNVQVGGTVVLPTDDPLDILSIKYSTETSGSNTLLVVKMTVSDLSTIPATSNWRMNLSANAPSSQMSPTGQYTFGISDRGDQFFVRASTDTNGAQTFVYGTAARNFSGGIDYTDRGTADAGAFDQVNKTITVKVALSKLNALLPSGHAAIGHGSTLAGLRGQAFTTLQGNNARLDTTRGGTQFTMNTAPVAVNDSYNTNQNTALNVSAPGVLANDTDADHDPLTASLVTNPSHGTLTFNSNGSFSYTPASNFSGADSFTYKANDGFSDSNIASVTINVATLVQSVGKTTGSGEIKVFSPDGVASFGFNVQRQTAGGSITGSLNYYNNARGLNVVSTSITSLTINGNTAIFSGACTKNGTACTFSVTVQDNAEPGKNADKFTISVSGEPVEGNAAITKGNVQVH